MPRRVSPEGAVRGQGQYGADEECVAKAVLAASHDDAGFSEDPSVSRSRSTSEDAGSDAAGTTRASLGYAQLQSSTHQMAGEQKQAENFGAAPAASCDADADGLSGDDFDDIDEGGVMESDDGEDGDMEEDDEEEEEEMEDEQQQEAQEEPAQQTCCVADFDERKLEATTHWSKAHEARMCRVVETCFPGHGMICFERMYRTSRPVQEITRESLLLRDHILLPELVASKVKSFACCAVGGVTATACCSPVSTQSAESARIGRPFSSVVRRSTANAVSTMAPCSSCDSDDCLCTRSAAACAGEKLVKTHAEFVLQLDGG